MQFLDHFLLVITERLLENLALGSVIELSEIGHFAFHMASLLELVLFNDLDNEIQFTTDLNRLHLHSFVETLFESVLDFDGLIGLGHQETGHVLVVEVDLFLGNFLESLLAFFDLEDQPAVDPFFKILFIFNQISINIVKIFLL